MYHRENNEEEEEDEEERSLPSSPRAALSAHKSLTHMREKVFHLIEKMGEAQVVQDDSSSDICSASHDRSCCHTLCENTSMQEKKPAEMAANECCPCKRPVTQAQSHGKLITSAKIVADAPVQPTTPIIVIQNSPNNLPSRIDQRPATILSRPKHSPVQMAQCSKVISSGCMPTDIQAEQSPMSLSTTPYSCHPAQAKKSSSERMLLCPCDCEPGPDSPCIAKRTTTTKFKDFFCKLGGGSADSGKLQVEHQNQLYAVKMKDEATTKPPPRRLVFELVDGIPKPMIPQHEKLTQTEVEAVEKIEATEPVDLHQEFSLQEYQEPVEVNGVVASAQENISRFTDIPENEKVEIYYFDHGNSGYYRTTDCPPTLVTDDFFEQTDMYATRFWAEIFGTLHIGLSFVTAFILQTFRFLLYSIVRPLVVGTIQLASDYFFKPLLSILFNGIIQPILILLYNVATSFRDVCEPIAQGIGFFIREIANLCRSIRLVDVNIVRVPKERPGCRCHQLKKV